MELMKAEDSRKESLTILVIVILGLIAVYFGIGLWRIFEVASGGDVQPVPFLDAPWKLLFKLVR